MNTGKTLLGVLCYEFLMQIRRPVLWIAFLLFGWLVQRGISNNLHNPEFIAMHFTGLNLAAAVTLIGNWLSPLAVGIFLADRLVRDRRLRVDEVLNTLPMSLGSRMWGKYLGTTLASLTLAFLLFLGTTIYVLSQTGNIAILPLCLFTYVVIVLPGILFVSAFSLACPVIIWAPLYQFLFFGYWFWGNELPSSVLPTLNGTIITPMGSVIATGLFDIKRLQMVPAVSVLTAWESFAVLLIIPVLVMIVLIQGLKWQQARA
jgi:hypothetical protein